MTNKEEKSIIRPPVVTVLGHIDHGKSSLLCAIKDFKITENESGGITQHIAAYEIEHENKKITFVDTPGHEAFSAMRSRGAKVADIAILVVAAEEGIKPQTKEVITHIKDCSIPVIIAINKMDKPTADPARVKRELAEKDLLVESEGGKIPSIEISAKTGDGIPDLLDLILLVSEIEDLKTNLSDSTEGIIIESHLDNKRGPTTTLLVKQGILKTGDFIGTNSTHGKVKILENFQNEPLQQASPSMPAVIIGFNEIPQVGEKFKTFSTLESARKNIPEKGREQISIEPNEKTMNIILKTDVLGSLEAIKEVLGGLPQENGKLKIVKGKVGEITEKDLKLAQSTKAIIVGFKTKADSQISKMSQGKNIKIITFDIIYDLIEEIKTLMERRFKPKKELKEIGKVKVLEIFLTKKKRQIIGGKVVEGEVLQGSKIEVLNGEEQKTGEGKIVTLQQEKKRTDKVKKGERCGILFEGNAKIEEGNILSIKVYE